MVAAFPQHAQYTASAAPASTGFALTYPPSEGRFSSGTIEMSDTTVTVWIPGDQLLRAHPAIEAAESRSGRRNIRIVLVESEIGRAHV